MGIICKGDNGQTKQSKWTVKGDFAQQLITVYKQALKFWCTIRLMEISVDLSIS